MRIFTLVVSIIFVVIGVVMIRDGDRLGWTMTAFFGACFVVAIFQPRMDRFRLNLDKYTLVITPDDFACEHRQRKRESIRWADVNQIWYITTDTGPRLPDEWFLFDGENGGCSFPTEAEGMKAMWDEIEQRFPGFDYDPIVKGPIVVARHLCWERQRSDS
jgi:hypothetical protein